LIGKGTSVPPVETELAIVVLSVSVSVSVSASDDGVATTMPECLAKALVTARIVTCRSSSGPRFSKALEAIVGNQASVSLTD